MSTADAGGQVWVVWGPPPQPDQWLRQALAGWQGEPVVLYGDEVTVDELLALASTASLLGQPRVLVVRRAQELGRADVRRMCQALAAMRLPREDRLVLVDGSEDGWVVSFCEAFAREHGMALEAVRLGTGQAAGRQGAEREQTLVQEMRHRGLQLTPAAQRLVSAALARSPERTAVELDKLAAYPDRPLDEAAARLLMAQDLVEAGEPADQPAAGPAESAPADRRRFWACEAALAGQAGRALSWMERLLAEGFPAPWLFRELARQCMQLWEVAEALERRYGPPSAWPARLPPGVGPSRLGPAAAGRLVGIARRLGTAGLLHALEEIARAEHLTKRGTRPEEALQQLVLRLAGMVDRLPQAPPPAWPAA
ncbi:MAG TPA: hypothetical protein VIL11_07180 [Limnochordales bacterium]